MSALGSSIVHALILASLALSCAACGTTFNSATGDDGKRAGATEIPIGEPQDDRVSAEDGDHSDWKTFFLETEAQVTINVHWDDEDVEARVVLRNPFGTVLFAASQDGGDRHLILGPLDLARGEYFLQIEAEDGSSVYTVEIDGGGPAASGRPDF
jgi:hypothetical protein